MNNIHDIGSDMCSTMMGRKTGFQKLLKDDIPPVFIMRYVCHSSPLCASRAVSDLPTFLETFLKDVTPYFSRSAERQRDFSLIQEVGRESPLGQWLALWFRNSKVVVSNPVEDGQGYELFGEVALRNRRFHLFKKSLALPFIKFIYLPKQDDCRWSEL